MEEHNVLGHLLKIEAEAAALAEDARAEVDRRIAEGEKENRARYEERYRQETARLQAAYEEEVAAMKKDHEKQLDDYQKSLDTMRVDTQAFSELVNTLLIQGV
jgi:regulator of protease activity HflC (stomatin/prohibitin superfamily)